MTASPTDNGYYAEARTWNQDRIEASNRLARIAWACAVAGGAIALLEAIALMLLLPLKSVIPYTILVDRHTGYVQTLRGDETPSLRSDDALIQALLAQYVVARESFDISDVSEQYRKVTLWSAGPSRGDYIRFMDPSNQAGPIAQLGRGGRVKVEVRSVQMLSLGRALVRFSARRLDGDAGERQQPEYYVSLVQYRFVDSPQKLKDRFDNPLGFQVFEYRRDQETPPKSDRLEPDLLIGGSDPMAEQPAAKVTLDRLP